MRELKIERQRERDRNRDKKRDKQRKTKRWMGRQTDAEPVETRERLT